MDEFEAGLREAFTVALQAVSSGERIGAALRTLRVSTDALASLAERDPELAPEILSALGHLNEAGEALGRAFTFVQARLGARADNLFPDKGGTE